AGSTGPPGTAGADGKTVLNGTTNPTAGIGNNGDFYINTATNFIWGPKAGGAWPGSGVSLVGPQGSQGIKGDTGSTGSQGPPGTTGAQGNPGADGKTVLNGTTVPAAGTGNNGDFYIRTTTNEIYGPKTSGAWGSPTSLVGPQGLPGPTGSTGSQGPPGDISNTPNGGVALAKLANTTQGNMLVRATAGPGPWEQQEPRNMSALVPVPGDIIGGQAAAGGAPRSIDAGLFAPFLQPQGRLTITAGTPVLPINATAGATVYYVPYVG